MLRIDRERFEPLDLEEMAGVTGEALVHAIVYTSFDAAFIPQIEVHP